MRRGWVNRTNPISLVLPIIIAIIVFVIIVKAVMSIGWWSENPGKEWNGVASVNILPATDAKVSIYMSSDTQNEITGPTKMFTSDKMVRVTSGESDVEIEGSLSKLSIESLSELSYKGLSEGTHSFELLNGYVWMETPNGDLTLKMKFFDSKFAPGSVVLANQNTRASNIYVLKWEAEIRTEKGTARIGGGQMLSLLQSESKNENLWEKIQPLDEFIQQSNMFIKKNGASFLSNPDVTTASWATASGTLSWTGSSIGGNTEGKAVAISYPEDEMTVETEKITIEGRLLNPNVKKLVFGKQDAKIISPDLTFSVKDFLLADETTDINYRAYDESGVQIEKWVLTVHLKKKSTQKKPDVINYPVSSKDFKIISPAENPFKTTDSAVKIRGSFAPDLVKFIKVNNYQLQQFKQFWTSWVYNASIENGNMEEWVNEYLITYYGPNDEILYTSKIYIVKEKPAEPALPPSGTTAPSPTSASPSSVTPSTSDDKKPASGSGSSSL